MDPEAGLTTYQKAVLRDKEAQKLFATSSTLGEKISLLEGLTCLYYPGQKAVVVDIHGGGFCFKSVLDNDAYCAYLQKTFGYAVLNADFTLSYKKGYPTQILEIVSETHLFFEKYPQYRTLPLFVVGHSSGANLAVAVTLRLGNVAGCVLNYPFLDLARDPATRPLLPETFPNFLLSDWVTMYCPDKLLRKHVPVSPIYMDKLTAETFPPCFISVADHCRLKEDGIRFHEILDAAKVPNLLLSVDERHGFIERHMRNIFLTPEDPAVKNAQRVTDQSFAFLSKEAKL
jgi:acetyl esterase/lipase